MIRVEFTLFDGSIVNFSIKGHADLAEEGKDILCAAVSIYSINTINSLTEIVGVEDALDIKADKGDLYLKIRYELMTDPQKEQAELLLRSMELAFKSLENEYNKYLKICYKEV